MNAPIPTGEPCADAWEGVTCESGNVTELSLYGVGMTGTLPPSLADRGALTKGASSTTQAKAKISEAESGGLPMVDRAPETSAM